MHKGEHGVPLLMLGQIAKETVNFLTKLSVDISDPSSAETWTASDFSNNSVMFDVQRSRRSTTERDEWRRALVAVISNDYSDTEINVRVTPDTRAQFWKIPMALPEKETVMFGIGKNGPGSEVEWFEISHEMARKVSEERPEFYRSYGEIQGVVHAFFKETKRPKLLVRELSTRALVHCFLSQEQYEGAVALLEKRDAVIFIEGDVKEDASTGQIVEMDVKDFTPAPDFDAVEFEKMIGTIRGLSATNET